MTDNQVKEILDRVLTWPSAMQEDAAHVLLALEATEHERYFPDENEWAAIQQGQAQARAGDVVPPEEIELLLKPRG